MLWANSSIQNVSAVLTVGRCLAQVPFTWKMDCPTVRQVRVLDSSHMPRLRAQYVTHWWTGISLSKSFTRAEKI